MRSGQLARLAARRGTSQPHHDMPDIATRNLPAAARERPKPPQAKPAPQTLLTRTLHIFQPRVGEILVARASPDQAERAHLNALTGAHEAHNERMALQRRMSGVADGRQTRRASSLQQRLEARASQSPSAPRSSAETRPYVTQRAT